MCYSTDDLVNPKTEVTYDENLPYGTDGYRTDCNNIEVNVLFTVQFLARNGQLYNGQFFRRKQETWLGCHECTKNILKCKAAKITLVT